jgi:hypothetical protein
VAFDLLRDVILDKVPDELILAEKALEAGIVIIGYLESHKPSAGSPLILLKKTTPDRSRVAHL